MGNNVSSEQGSLAGYYNLAIRNSASDPEYINGKPYWIHKTNDYALWFNINSECKDGGKWVFTPANYLGNTSKCFYSMIARIPESQNGIWPHEIKIWQYYSAYWSQAFNTTDVDVLKGT